MEIFKGDFRKNLQRITETSNNFIEKLQRNPKEILEIFRHSQKYARGISKLYPALKIWQIFFKTILY